MEQPTIQQVVNIDLAAPNEEISKEGIRYVYNLAPELDIIKLELVFKAGRKFEWKPLVSKLTANMLKLGTENLSSEAFAEQFEYFGTELKLREGFNFISFSVSFGKRHLETITDLIIQCVTQPLFSEAEFDKLKRRLSQQLKVSLKKSDVVAFRLFTEAIFGSDHPYGYNTTNEAIQSVAISDIKDFFGKLMDWKKLDDLIPKSFKSGSKYKRTGKAGIFAGSLELVKEGNLSIKQENLFDDIYIKENK